MNEARELEKEIKKEAENLFQTYKGFFQDMKKAKKFQKEQTVKRHFFMERI